MTHRRKINTKNSVSMIIHSLVPNSVEGTRQPAAAGAEVSPSPPADEVQCLSPSLAPVMHLGHLTAVSGVVEGEERAADVAAVAAAVVTRTEDPWKVSDSVGYSVHLSFG